MSETATQSVARVDAMLAIYQAKIAEPIDHPQRALRLNLAVQDVQQALDRTAAVHADVFAEPPAPIVPATMEVSGTPVVDHPATVTEFLSAAAFVRAQLGL